MHLFTCIQVINAQCPVPTSLPISSPTDPVISEGEILTAEKTKWFKSTGSINSLTIKGGTVIVSGKLTITNLKIESGEIYIMPGATLTVGGTGVSLNGNTKIFNYGAMNLLANIDMQGSPTSATPNCLVNASSTSTISMPNQYFLINAPNSQFINHGIADFGGLLTWTNSAPHSVILENGSVTNMQSMFNYVQNAYSVPSGSACVSVESTSYIYQKLTNSSNLNLVLPSVHTCNGCISSPWGDAKVFSNTPSCASITPLPVTLSNLTLSQQNNCNIITWQANIISDQVYFILEHSTDGENFKELARLSKEFFNKYRVKDCNPTNGKNHYRIKIVDQTKGEVTYSKLLSTKNVSIQKISAHPNPFVNQFTVNLTGQVNAKSQFLFRNSIGQVIPITAVQLNNSINIYTPENLKAGVYFFQLITDAGMYNYRLVKNN
ncbi:MAG TPA: T9SS type A sorting domain-containing protein [Flavisolibacter sp.]|nr:T9SS type A sorting domain-containing protein [Flavisolibacter sp.]